MVTQEDVVKVQEIINGAELVEKLGKSTLGSVYKIIHPEFKTCVLKILEGKASRNEKFLQRFIGPMAKARDIVHESVARIYDTGKNFIVREFVPGRNLQNTVNGQALSLLETTRLMSSLLSGLEMLHSLEIVHKNLKPNNLIVDGFNLKIVDLSLPPTTAHFLSPEQCKGKKSKTSSDIYAFGLLYHYCLSGNYLYPGYTAREVMEAHLAGNAGKIRELSPGLPEVVIGVLEKSLAKQPQERPQYCGELLPVLKAIIDTELQKQQSTESEASDVPGDAPTIELVDYLEPPSAVVERIGKFKQVATEMANKLKTVNQTLCLLNDMQVGQESDSLLFLDEMLRFVTAKTGEVLGADRTIIFLMDEEKDELLLIEEDGEVFNRRISTTEGIAGEIVASHQAIDIPYDFYDDPRSRGRMEVDKITGYRTYTMLALPLLDSHGNLVAVVQLLNKLKSVSDPDDPLLERIDKDGFGVGDEKIFQEFALPIRMILESSSSLLQATQRQKAAASLMSAIQSLTRCGLDLEDTLNRVMNEAKQLLNADRITLWLLDDEKDELWASIEMADGAMEEIRIPRNVGFAGQVAESGKPLLIPCDLYDHPDSKTAKSVDQKTGYRTCSMLCMPVFNADDKLIGVTQLINKIRQGYPDYEPKDWPKIPDCWKASFSASDLEFMRSFNIQAGVALQNARMFATIKQQEQMQRDILRSLTNGVISTDKSGEIIAANESARKLLGMEGVGRIEQRPVSDLLQIKDGNFTRWLSDSLNEKSQQYYPEQTLISCDGEHSINLSINSIADVEDSQKLRGALVVMDDISHEKRMKNMMYRYMTQEVVEQLLASGNVELGGKREEVTVLFSDIRSYTTLTEGMEAEDVVAMLNDYFEVMVDAVFKYQGTLDKYIGDAIMAVFGTPMPLKDHPWCAVQTALEMRRQLSIFNENLEKRGKQTIRIGIGVHTDEVVSGNIGSSKRMELTCIGDGVNLASRLEGASKQYGCDIIISENSYLPCAEKIHVRELDLTVVKGKTEPVKIYDIIGEKSDSVSPEKMQMIELYQQGRRFYLDREFEKASTKFERVLEIFPRDMATGLHIERCRHFLKQPPAEDWDGVWKLTSK